MQTMPKPKAEDLRGHFDQVKNSQNPVILRLCELIRKAQEDTGDRTKVQKHT